MATNGIQSGSPKTMGQNKVIVVLGAQWGDEGKNKFLLEILIFIITLIFIIFKI